MNKQELIEKYQKEIEDLKEGLEERDFYDCAADYYIAQQIKSDIRKLERLIKDLEKLD